MSERKTENLVRDALRNLNYYDEDNGITIEEQKSENATIKKLLKSASKTGGRGAGYPEFIIQSSKTKDFIIIVECKLSTKFHESPSMDRVKDFAVDGVLHYASFIAKEYNVIAVAVSGQNFSEAKISTFLFPKKSTTPKELTNTAGTPIDKIIPFEEYIKHGTYDKDVERRRYDDLMAFSRELHEFMREHARLTESEKPLLVSGTLLALRNKVFAKSYSDYEVNELPKAWFDAIKEEMKKANIPNSKNYNMTQPYSSIAVHPELGKSTKNNPKGNLYELIHMLNERVWPFISVYHNFDVVGQFYGEFLKYTGGDKKALGIVLTPRHIAELFALLANAKKDSKVLDICCGTAGFLVASMSEMMRSAITDEERNRIKDTGLIGVEQQPNMYALAASNMILRGDGKANLYQGSCFDHIKELKKHKANIGMINPPYAQSDADLHELMFVQTMLDCLGKGGDSIGIAIVPMSCAISPHPVREEILKHHCLEAVMSMPGELFYPVGVVACIMVFAAHKPHSHENKKTWFGYWKDDGFVKTKHLGRIDLDQRWNGVKKSWVEAFRNRDEIPGLSVKQQVTATDEWCAEAYMETNYADIKPDDFEQEIKKFLVFNLLNDPSQMTDPDDDEEEGDD